MTNQLYDFISMRYAFFSEVGIGFSANTILLIFHIFTFLLQHRLKPTNLITGLLALVHIGMLIIMGYTATNIYFAQEFWDDIKCKSLLYLHRFLRGFSIYATSLLSVLQAITLSPRSSCLAKFKCKSPQQSMCSFMFLWVFYIFLNAQFLFPFTVIPNVTSHGLVFFVETCKILPMSYFLRHLSSILGVFWDVFLIGLMAFSSGYLINFLCRHKRHFQHLHSTSLSPKSSPVQRATRTIPAAHELFHVHILFGLPFFLLKIYVE